MTIEQTIVLQLVDESNKPLALPNVIMVINFFTGGRHRYGFFLDPTDGQGRLRISYEDVETERRDNAKESLMDYNTPLTECDPQIQITIPTDEELKRSYEVATRWAGRGVTPNYAREWLTANNAKIRSTKVVAELGKNETVVLIPCKLATA